VAGNIRGVIWIMETELYHIGFQILIQRHNVLLGQRRKDLVQSVDSTMGNAGQVMHLIGINMDLQAAVQRMEALGHSTSIRLNNLMGKYYKIQNYNLKSEFYPNYQLVCLKGSHHIPKVPHRQRKQWVL